MIIIIKDIGVWSECNSETVAHFRKELEGVLRGAL